MIRAQSWRTAVMKEFLLSRVRKGGDSSNESSVYCSNGWSNFQIINPLSSKGVNVSHTHTHTGLPFLRSRSTLLARSRMHHALQIDEILLNIFARFCSEACALPALARTCRTFKEPALDLLWGKLHSLAPLAQCLPEACLDLTSTDEVG